MSETMKTIFMFLLLFGVLIIVLRIAGWKMKKAADAIVEAAVRSGATSIAYTFTEPTIFFELAYDTAVKAHEWITIRPATDGALALAMGHVIVRDNLYDKAFVDNWTVGFAEYAAYVKDKTPVWAEKITSVPAAPARA